MSYWPGVAQRIEPCVLHTVLFILGGQMKRRWLDNTHVYVKGKPTMRHRKAQGHEYIYMCTICDSWVSWKFYEDPEWQRTKRPGVNFCIRAQGMLFDKQFRREKT